MAYSNSAHFQGRTAGSQRPVLRGKDHSDHGGGQEPKRWPFLADDMFRLAHHDHGGLVLHAHVAALGLAAALLGELVLTDSIRVRDGLVRVPAGAAPLQDALAHTVFHHMAAERVDHPVRTWLAFFARHSYRQVALRLQRAGHVREQVTRRVWSRTVRYVPVDMNTAAWPWARLSSTLRTGRPLDAFDTLLGGLVLATDLHRQVLLGTPAELTAQLRHTITIAPSVTRELLAHTEAAVGAAVITGT